MTQRLGLAAAIAAALATVLASVAVGHAALQSSDPADGATIKTPYTLVATYDDELTPNGSSIVVENSSGTQVASGTVDPEDDKQMTAQVPQLPDGAYTVLWTAVTADDAGLTRGTFHFNVSASLASGSATATTPAPSAAAGPSTGSGSDLLIPIAIVVVVVAGIAAYFVYRNRR